MDEDIPDAVKDMVVMNATEDVEKSLLWLILFSVP